MKVIELIELLEEQDPDATVLPGFVRRELRAAVASAAETSTSANGFMAGGR